MARNVLNIMSYYYNIRKLPVKNEGKTFVALKTFLLKFNKAADTKHYLSVIKKYITEFNKVQAVLLKHDHQPINTHISTYIVDCTVHYFIIL
jgi:hypothetical protein